jgi:DNA-binding IclR family transcriptional regulator
MPVDVMQEGKQPKAEGVAAVERALAILAAFEQASEPLTLSELSRRTGLYKSTALRLLESLRKFGYVSLTSGGRYELGPTVLRLGRVYQQNSRLQEKLLPAFQQIVAAGSESPSFFIRQGRDERLCVFRLDSNHSTLDRVKAGLVLPLDRGAAGHVIRAFDDGAKGATFDKIRADGYAISYSETSPDCAAVAAPIFGENGILAGALSVSGLRFRFTEEAIPDQLEYLVTAATAICAAFGGRFPY